MTTDNVLRRVLAHGRTAPNRLAVEDPHRALSYAELSDEAARVAAALHGEGIAPGDRVVLLLANSVDFVVAALAAMWVGAAFVPLAVTDPVARLASIIADCGPALAIARDGDLDAVAGSGDALGVRTVTVSALRDEAHPRVPLARGSHISYVIYTSGTTGAPKGVLIGESAFGAAVGAASSVLGLDRTTRALCVSPFHFDGSFGTLFPTLASGGSAVMREREALLFIRPFFDTVRSEAITFTGFSPSYMRLLLASRNITTLAGSTLRTLAIGGEASSAADIRAMWAAAPELRIFNRYGPTETTIAVSYAELSPEKIADGVVPIGLPCDGVTFHLARDDGTLIERVGEVGELYIGGAQLMTGYWGAPDLTAEVLRNDIVPGRAVYRTGDRVYRDADRGYVYVERADRVVKRFGVRVSLVEVGEAIRETSGASAVACIAFGRDGTTGIASFLVFDTTRDVDELRERARARLPDAMLPDRFVVMDALPLTASGKLDERALLAAAGLSSEQHVASPALEWQ